MEKYIMLNNDYDTSPRTGLTKDIILNSIETADILLTLNKLMETRENVTYEVSSIISLNDYKKLWNMAHSQGYDEKTRQEILLEIENLKYNNDEIDHACFVEIKVDGYIVKRGFVNYLLFDQINQRFISKKTKIR